MNRVPAVEAPREAHELVDPLRRAAGPSLRAVLLFGSQLVRAAPDRHSAWDLVLVVDDYRAFHRHLVEAGHHRRPAWMLTLLAGVLPPSITAFDPGAGLPLAKCAIVTEAHFVRAMGPRAPDHFLKGRMAQKVALVWACDDASRATVLGALDAARRDVLRWAGPFLEGSAVGFTAETLARRMLEVSYAGEVRPERGDRVRQVFEVQRDFLSRAYHAVLVDGVERGVVESAGDERFRLVDPPDPGRRRALGRYFLRSKVRATLRWAKHVLTFNDWLTYIQRKAERRTGLTIEITNWERRLPFLLLWPKAVRVLRARNVDEEPS